MTFSATSLILTELLRNTQLLSRHPLRQIGELKRGLFVAPSVAAVIDGNDLGFPHYEADFIMSKFMHGHVVSISSKMGVKADLELLEGVDEVWAMCFRKPPPGYRVLGRFAGKDEFVGLTIHDRHELGGDRYRSLANEVPVIWGYLFRSTEPFRSNSIRDYVSEPMFVVGEEL